MYFKRVEKFRKLGYAGGASLRCVPLALRPPSYPNFRALFNETHPFEIISEITEIETIAVGRSIRDIRRLRKQYGHGRWRKMKGSALIRLRNGRIREAEIHGYEAHGIGRKEFKRKCYLD